MFRFVLLVQAIFFTAFAAAWGLRPESGRMPWRLLTQGDVALPTIDIPRNKPLEITPLFDRADLPEIVSEEELAYVLKRIRPRFEPRQMRPNLVEHALRTWGLDAQFSDPEVPSGQTLGEFLTDHGRFAASWGEQEQELLVERPAGIEIRYGRTRSGSVHHDHWLASLTEAGVSRDTPVYGPGRRGDSIDTVLREALVNFRLDEREAEWTALAYGLWLPPTTRWTGSGGRQYSFDLIAQRLMRGEGEKGVCNGTHRVYSLVVLLRLDDQFPEVLSDDVRPVAQRHLERVRDAIAAAQFDDGHWPGNWPLGADARLQPREDKLSTLIIATGHHLEWQAIAPADLRLSDAQNRRAVEWLLTTLRGHSPAQVMANYTFYTHVGNAFALWRKTRPTPFWRDWTARHPEFELAVDPTIPPDPPADATTAPDARH